MSLHKYVEPTVIYLKIVSTLRFYLNVAQFHTLRKWRVIGANRLETFLHKNILTYIFWYWSHSFHINRYLLGY